MENNRWKEIKKILPEHVKLELEERKELWKEILEIRIRLGKNICIIKRKGEELLNTRIIERDIQRMMECISGYSIYACEHELRQGFITLKGGHRVGITGEVVLENERIKTLKNITSFNIRFSREVIGCGDGVIDFLKNQKGGYGNLLLVSPPCVGKTTLLRDLLRQISNMPGENVGIVDERSEIAACYRGCPSNDVGERTDVLDGCPKAEGMLMLLRSMSPSVIGVDELGKKEDIEAVLRVINCGVHIIATIHGENLDEVREKSVYTPLFQNTVFSHFLVLDREYINIYDKNGIIEKRVLWK